MRFLFLAHSTEKEKLKMTDHNSTQKSNYKVTNTEGNIIKKPNPNLNKNNNEQNEIVKTHLRRIFEYYCQFGERMNVSSLKSHKYQKMAIDANLLDGKLTKTKLELIYASENKTRVKTQMDFDTFMNSLIKIAEIKFVSNKNDILNKFSNKQASALLLLLKYHLWPLYEKIFECPVMLTNNNNSNSLETKILSNNPQILNTNEDLKKQIAQKDKKEILLTSINKNTKEFTSGSSSHFMSHSKNNLNTSTNLNHRLSINTINMVNNLVNVDDILGNPKIEEILHSVAPVMYEVYKVYFPWELSMSEDENFLREQSSKAFFIFLKEFDLCPSLVNKSAAFQIFISETLNFNKESNENYSYILKNIEINPLGRSNNKNTTGKFFTFMKFIKTICKIGDLGFEKNENVNNLINMNTSSDYNNQSKLENTLNKFTIQEKISFTFERMELSEGFLTIQQKTNKTHSRKTSCIISRNLLEKVKLDFNERLKEEESDNSDSSDNIGDALSTEINKQNHRMMKLKTYNLGNMKDMFEYSEFIIEKFGNNLNGIFKYYCSFGDPFNTTALKPNKFYKLLKEAGLIRQNNTASAYFNNLALNNSFTSNGTIKNASNNFGIKVNDVDLMFFKISGVTNDNFQMRGSIKSLNKSLDITQVSQTSPDPSIVREKRGSMVNSNAKLDFNGFVNAIELISLILFPNKSEYESIEYIIKCNILPLQEKFINKKNDFNKIILDEETNNKDFADVLSILYKSMTPIYRFYHNKNSEINLEAFFKFCNDFEIFPELVSKSKLNNFFKTTYTNDMIFTDENEFINQKMLIYILAQCAFDIPYGIPEPSSVEKILLFIEKISLSEGTNILIKEYGQSRTQLGETLDFLSLFKNQYPYYFNAPETRKAGFFDVFNQKN